MKNNSKTNRRPGIENLGPVLTSMIYTVEVSGVPTVAFEAASLISAEDASSKLWSRVEVASMTSNYAPLWNGEARLSVRPATDREMELYWRAAEATDKPSETVAYLVEIDPA
jgi:hypothetical protein